MIYVEKFDSDEGGWSSLWISDMKDVTITGYGDNFNHADYGTLGVKIEFEAVKSELYGKWLDPASHEYSIVGVQDKWSGPQDLLKKIPGLAERTSCPKCHKEEDCSIFGLIQHLNDHHGMSREDIANWLETLDIDLRFEIPDENQ